MPELALMDVTARQRGRTVRLRVREFGRFSVSPGRYSRGRTASLFARGHDKTFN